MADDAKHHAVVFAERYSDTSVGYLNAGAALWRVGELIDDAEELKAQLDAAMPEKKRWHPWVGAEIVSYYSVGLVTCLEWHARSRLVDLLTFMPQSFKVDDLKVMRDKVVVETLASNVTVASVVGAATNISTLEDYMGVFKRLFIAFGLKTGPYDAIKATNPKTGTPWVEPEQIETLQNLYTFRNDLVHEIGISRVGHFNVRERWDPTEAIETARLIREVIKAIEAVVTAMAPKGFPNLLDDEGYPTSEFARIKDELPALEKAVGKTIADFKERVAECQGEWSAAIAASEISLTRELEFIDNWPILFNRYVDMQGRLKLALVKSRRDYLEAIVEMVGSVYETAENEETEDSGKS